MINLLVVNFKVFIVSCFFNFELVLKLDVDIEVKVEFYIKIKDESDIISILDIIF